MEPDRIVRKLGILDMEAVMKLERLCFAYHWQEKQFRLALEKGAFMIYGIEIDKKLVAYLAFSLIKDEMEILNLAVDPEYRRLGLATRLLSVVVRECLAKGMKYAFLDVKKSNRAARDLYVKFGFKQIGIRKNYYPDTKEDALLFKRIYLKVRAFGLSGGCLS